MAARHPRPLRPQPSSCCHGALGRRLPREGARPRPSPAAALRLGPCRLLLSPLPLPDCPCPTPWLCGSMVEKRCGLYRWFSEWPSLQRVEFQCGLLDLCIHLQLCFLGSSLEDLARKDCHSQCDSESKVDNPANLGSLSNLTKEAVHSKLLVSLGSEQREPAGVLYRMLKGTYSTMHDYGLQLDEGLTSPG